MKNTTLLVLIISVLFISCNKEQPASIEIGSDDNAKITVVNDTFQYIAPVFVDRDKDVDFFIKSETYSFNGFLGKRTIVSLIPINGNIGFIGEYYDIKKYAYYLYDTTTDNGITTVEKIHYNSCETPPENADYEITVERRIFVPSQYNLNDQINQTDDIKSDTSLVFRGSNYYFSSVVEEGDTTKIYGDWNIIDCHNLDIENDFYIAYKTLDKNQLGWIHLKLIGQDKIVIYEHGLSK